MESNRECEIKRGHIVRNKSSFMNIYSFLFVRVRVGNGCKEVPACGDGCGPCQVHSVVHDLAWPVDLSSSGMYSFACCTIITGLGGRQT